MSETTQERPQGGWSNAFDCAKIFGTFRMARQPGKIGLALVALLLTWLWGTMLDTIWVRADEGVIEETIEGYVHATRSGETSLGSFVEKQGEYGVFRVYSMYWRLHVARLTQSVIPRDGLDEVPGDLISNTGNLCRATAWLIRYHPIYCLLFLPVVLLIWAIFGGMICRIAAVQFARDEVISLTDAFAFVRKKLWGGFFLAPLAPALWILVCGLVLWIGGLLLSIPYFGDVLGGLFFFVAILVGLAIAVLTVGLAGGGSLLWPAIAAEGTTSFDAFATSFHYVYSRPWRAAFYGLIAFVYGSICWLVVGFFAHLTLLATHAFVGLGTKVAPRTISGVDVSKLDTLWTYEFLGRAYVPMLEGVHGVEYVPMALIAMWVYLLIGIVWAFLFSIYFCAATAIYFLLRRAVDLTDYERVEEIEEYEDDQRAQVGPAPRGAPATSRTAQEVAAAESPVMPTVEPPPVSEPPPTESGGLADAGGRASPEPETTDDRPPV